MKKWMLMIIALSLTKLICIAQEHPEGYGKHQLQLILSHTQILSAVDPEGNKKWQSLPSWGVNYNYRLSEKWKTGLHNDIIVEDFQVASLGRNKAEVLKRRSPISTVLVVSRRFDEHFHLLLGIGGEFAENENFLLMRGGIEYVYHFHEKWELIINITNDFKWDGYNSWTVGLGTSRLF